MQITMPQRPLPSAIAIEAEAARIERMIAAVTTKIESSDCNLRTFMHLQVCRAELQTYFAGLLYALGYTNLLDTHHVETHLAPSKTATFGSIAEALKSAGITEEFEKCPRLVQCYEC
jgi:hypothetical protein